jgi:hypothetical protein
MTREDVRVGAKTSTARVSNLSATFAVTLHLGDRLDVERHTARRVRLCVLFDDATAGFDQTATDGELAESEIEIAPSERAQLAAARAGRRRKAEEHRKTWIDVFGRDHEAEDVGRFGKDDGVPLRSRWRRGSGRVGGEPPPPHGLAERAMQQRVDAHHRVRRELSPSLTSVPAKLSVPRAQVAGAKPTQRGRAETREDMAVEKASIVLGDDRGEIRLGLCVPTLAQVANGAGLRDDETVINLRDEPSKLAGCFTLRAVHGARDVLLASAVDVAPSVHAELPRLLSPPSHRPGHVSSVPGVKPRYPSDVSASVVA